MHKKLIIVVLLTFAGLAYAQTPLPTNVYGAGLSYNGAGAPEIAGDAFYARLLSQDSGTYSFTNVDAFMLPKGVVDTAITTGAGQKVLSLGKANVFVVTSIGVQTIGSATGWDWNGGGLVDVPVKGNWGTFLGVRFDKGSATNGTGYRAIVTAGARFGK